MKKKICVVTGTRAEYGLFYPFLKRLGSEKAFELRIIATGMHLSPEFGLTYKEIERDGFRIDEKVEMLLSSDTPAGISKSIGLGTIGFADAFSRLAPDIVFVLGDRFETFAAAIAAHVARIPVAHLHGGEVTEGAMDDAMRHSITKIAMYHFTSTEAHRRRVIQLGESPDRVFNTGAIGIDAIKTTRLLSRERLENEISFTFSPRTALVTFHPATLETNTSGVQFREILRAIDSFSSLKAIFTKPNADTEGRVIIKLIDEYVERNPGKAAAYISLGRLRYLSALRQSDLVIGNSSSGIIEAPFFGLPTVNVGDRQKGRERAQSVIDCPPVFGKVRKAVEKALSPEFKTLCGKVRNPYGTGDSVKKIMGVLKGLDFSRDTKKSFFDLNFSL